MYFFAVFVSATKIILTLILYVVNSFLKYFQIFFKHILVLKFFQKYLKNVLTSKNKGAKI